MDDPACRSLQEYVAICEGFCIHLQHHLFAGVHQFLSAVYNVNDGPEEIDMENAVTGILNIQFVHDLKSADVRHIFMVAP